MKKLKVGFSRPKKWKCFSAAIMWWQKTPFSHTFIRFNTRYGDLVYHASKTMVHFVSGKEFDIHNDIIFIKEYELTEEKYHQIIQFAVDNAGKPYSLVQICKIFWYELLEKMSININKPTINGNQAYICSELVAEALHYDIDNLDYVTPLDIYEYIKNQN